MKLYRLGDVYVAECSFSEKDLAKYAGFVWNSIIERRWATKSEMVARKLAEYADTDLRAALEHQEQPAGTGPPISEHAIKCTTCGEVFFEDNFDHLAGVFFDHVTEKHPENYPLAVLPGLL
jgi:hypothetical protein